MINIIGNFLGSSGYDIHTRELANALNKLTQVRIDAAVQANMAHQLNDAEVEMLKREPDNEINIIITSPMHWRLNTTAKRNWAYLIHEGDKIPKSWMVECLNSDIEYIFVPSTHTKQAILNTFVGHPQLSTVLEKIKLIHHGVDLNKFYPKKEEVASAGGTGGSSGDEFGRPVVFLCNKGFRNLEDRGGIQYAIKAYLREFNPEDKVELLLKLNPAYGIPDMNKLIDELKPNKPLPPIRIDATSYKYEDLIKVYHQAGVFVSPTRAESFNIPGAEAKACGLMTLQTGYGGQTDYMVEGTDLFIEYDLAKVEHEIQYEECCWAKPRIEDLRKKMRWCYENPDLVKKRGKQAREEIKEWTWEKTAKKIVELSH